MVRIRRVEIRNYRAVKSLDWVPSTGINCLIGPGDSGKSTILDAIDLCLGARRTAQLGDTDFFRLDVGHPISILLTLGELPDALKNIETYGDFLRGFDTTSGQVEDEPRSGLETVLTLSVKVESDLEPAWSLFSQRAEQQGIERNLLWKDRNAISPARIGSYASTNLSWTRGSVLNKISEERVDLGAELALAARNARATFGDQAGTQLSETLRTVTATAASLGVPVGASAKALLDAHSVSISDGAISLHDDAGVPLRSLGTGSVRLLVAGLQRAASEAASIALVDEVEYGLEPHRLVRLLDSLGAKEAVAPLQVFMTTHSPVAVRELSGDQVFVVRSAADGHQVLKVGLADDVQSTVRADPEAFLAKSVIVCEGASEVGFIRGLDLYRSSVGQPSLLTLGVSNVNVGGGDPDRCFIRGSALLRLGYRAFVLVDADRPPTPTVVASFVEAGGKFVSWRSGHALEDEVFLSLDDGAIHALLERAEALMEPALVDDHIRTHSQGRATLESVSSEGLLEGYSEATRRLLGRAARTGKNSWFKSVTKFEGVARDIVGPNLQNADPEFRALVDQIFGWAHAA
jgi:putative ATP-dependent endonuclease of the OLD family